MPIKITFDGSVSSQSRNEINQIVNKINSTGKYKSEYIASISFDTGSLPANLRENASLSAFTNGNRDIIINPIYDGTKSMEDRFLHEIIHVMYPGLTAGRSIGVHHIKFYEKQKELYENIGKEYKIIDKIYETDSQVYERLKKSECFLAGTMISSDLDSEVLIENIKPGMSVVSFHYDLGGDNLIRKNVTKIYENITKTIVNLRGIHCTPGHVFLTGDAHGHGRFDTIASILRHDGTLVEQDATVIRARTGAKLGQADDALVGIVYNDPPADGRPCSERRALVRAGIPLPPVMIKDDLAPARSLAQHLADHGITPLADGRLRTPDGAVHDACNWPEGATPFDTHEARNWIVQADGVPYCPPWIRDLVPEDETEGLRVVGTLSA